MLQIFGNTDYVQVRYSAEQLLGTESTEKYWVPSCRAVKLYLSKAIKGATSEKLKIIQLVGQTPADAPS